jgi:hypothetical protein
LNNPALNKAFAAGGVARDPRLAVTANQIASYSDPLVDPATLKFLDDVGTFNTDNPIEIRGGAARSTRRPSVRRPLQPTLLGVSYSALLPTTAERRPSRRCSSSTS